jgi:Zn-dependent peptidase ImmA (M78 family)
MNLTLTKIKEAFPQFNKKPITERDFWRVCKKRKIIVREMPLLVNGYYERKKSKDYILINSGLSGSAWLHTALHELAHQMFHIPGDADAYVLYRKKCGDDKDPRERFADAFALIGMLPFPDLVKLAHEDIVDDSYLMNICKARIIVRTDFGI